MRQTHTCVTPHWGLCPSPVPRDSPAEATAGRNSAFGKRHPLLGKGMSRPPDPNTAHTPNFLHFGGTQHLRLPRGMDKDCDIPLPRKYGLFTTPGYKPSSTSGRAPPTSLTHGTPTTTAVTDICQSDGGRAVGMTGSGVQRCTK